MSKYEFHTRQRLLGRLASAPVIPRSDGCFIWEGARNTGGYGYVLVNGRRVLLHRLVLELFEGRRLEPGEMAMHECDQRACIRPTHLRRGRAVDNARDLVEKRKSGTWRGGSCHRRLHNGA